VPITAASCIVQLNFSVRLCNIVGIEIKTWQHPLFTVDKERMQKEEKEGEKKAQEQR
jgi:hypothetical protein